MMKPVARMGGFNRLPSRDCVETLMLVDMQEEVILALDLNEV